MTIVISRKYMFSAAHRIEGHPKCGRLHGHNYSITVCLEGKTGEDGMVMDYGILDEIVKPLISDLDHRYIVSEGNIRANDPYALLAKELGHAVILPIQASTAECLATWIGSRLAFLEQKVSVIVEETPKSTAEFIQ